jgi:hypothetical protein
MSKNLLAAVKKRANQYDDVSKDSLYNELGRRLLEAMRGAGFTGPHEFSLSAFGVKTQAGNLSAQLKRLTADKPDASLMADQLVAYARAARVSLYWLITGDGAKRQGPFGVLTGDEMRGIPDELVRATRALMELENVSPKIALSLAERALDQNGARYLTPDSWLQRMRLLREDTGHESGLRPSTRVKAAIPTND